MRMLFKVSLSTAVFCCMIGSIIASEPHTITAPTYIKLDTPTNVAVNLHGLGAGDKQIQGQLTFTVDGQGGFEGVPAVSGPADKPIIVPVTYPRNKYKKTNRRQYVELTLVVNPGGIKIPPVLMEIKDESGYIEILADRTVFRPGEKFKYRIAAMNQDLNPDQDRIVQITVQVPPDFVGVDRTELLMPKSKQFITGEFLIPENPEIGIWRIQARYEKEAIVQKATREFLVERYVLPTYNVDVEISNLYILTGGVREVQEINGKIKAVYSYGKKIFGNYYLTAKLKRKGESAEEFYSFPGDLEKQAPFHDGERAFTIPIQPLQDILKAGESFTGLMNDGAYVYVEATVANRDEGTIESGISSHLRFTPSPYMIDVSRMSTYFTPGLTFPVKFDVIDIVSRKPVSGVDVTIMIQGNNAISRTTDANGQVYYTHPMPNDKDPKTITIATNTIQFAADEQASTSLTVNPYKSPTNNFIQLTSRLQKAEVPTIGFEITAYFNPWKTTSGDIRYLVLSRGEIISGGKVTPGANVQSVSLTMDITYEMVPSMRVLAYYKLANGEIVSNSLWVDVEDTCQVELSISLKKKEVLPGEEITVEYEGAPGAMIAVAAIDRASTFLFNQSRLSRDELFQKMNDYDLGCMRQGGKDGQHIFEVAGFQIVGGNFARKEEFLPACDGSSRKRRSVTGCPTPIIPSNGKLTPNKEIYLVGDSVSILCRTGFKISQATSLTCTSTGWNTYVMPTCVSSVKSNCYLDSTVENNAGLSCAKRAEYVRNNVYPEKDAIECARVFYLECDLNERKKKIGSRSTKQKARAVSQNSANLKQSGKLRTDFSENMVWMTDVIGADGKLSKTAFAKDSISTFEFDAMSLHESKGFCIAKTQYLKVFQDVFVQIKTPYSIRIREQVDISVIVFNYGPQDMQISLDVVVGKHLCSHYKAETKSWLSVVTVRSGTAETVPVAILPLRVPPEDGAEDKVTIEVHAYNDIDKALLDRVRKSILVEPEGVLKDDVRDTKSFDLKASQDKFEFNMQFPESTIPGTKKCQIYSYASYMGPVIQMDSVTKEPRDIGGLMKVPRGCGEQTMIYSGPNVFAFKYLRSVGKMPAGSAEETAALNKIKQGYTNEMKYRSNKVGKKAWAVWDHALPSMWLNAFVNKVFGYSKKCIGDMDVTPITNSINWITENQQPTGEFNKVYKVHHAEMHGAVGGSVTLTAYVLISLEESKHVLIGNNALKVKAQTAIDKAITFLEANEQHAQMNLPYVMALTSYGLNLVNPNSAFAKRIFAKLWNAKIYSNGNRLLSWKGADLAAANAAGLHSFWHQRRPSSIDVETTSYALLAYLTLLKTRPVTQADINNVKRIAAWLVEQRDENGAFTTTQDTVIGLQALGEYMTWANTYNPPSKDISLDVTFGGAEPTSWFNAPLTVHLDNSNENFTTPIQVPQDVIDIGGNVPVTVQGTGAGTVSYRCTYRTVNELELCQFDLSVTTEKLPLPNSQNFKLVIDVKTKEGIPEIGQAIIVIPLLTGYEVVEATLEAISKGFSVDGIIDRHEITNNNVILYLASVQRDPSISFAVIMKNVLSISKPDPVNVKVYDYYNPTVQCSSPYALPDDLVRLRTTEDCTKEGSQDMCKCAEGACLFCRDRDLQLKFTQCVDKDKTCNICTLSNPLACADMTALACQSHFLYIVKVTKEIPADDKGVLVQFEAEIIKVIKPGSDTNVRSQIRKFRIRNDCYQKCVDPLLDKPDRTLTQAERFILKGRELTIVGKGDVTVNKDKAGNDEKSYFLGGGAFIERTVPDAKCKSSRRNKIKNKCTKMGISEKCNKILQTIQICDNLLNLENVLSQQGCDVLLKK